MAEFVLRVIISDHDIRKVKLPSKPHSVEELHQSLQSKLNLTTFTILYQDSDFNNELCTLTDMEELQPFATVTIMEIVTAEAGTVESVAVDPHEAGASNLRRNVGWPKEFIIPKFDHDVEFLLAKGNAEFTEKGTLLVLPKSVKGSVLQKLACAMYDYKAYPNEPEFSAVAEALISKHPCLREAGSRTGYDGWRNSLQFKMGNYRAEIRKAGGEEVMINCGKRSKYRPELPAARASMKKPKRAEVNFLPNLPQSADSQDEFKKALQDELRKSAGARDSKTIRTLMARTFALRRQHIIKDCPRVHTMVDEWPAFFLQSEVIAEFGRVTNVSANNFFIKLDALTPKLLTFFTDKSATNKHIKQEMSTFSRTVNGADTVERRSAVLRCLSLHLSSDVKKIFKVYDADQQLTDEDLTDEDVPPHIAVVGRTCSIVMEQEVVMRDLLFPDAMQLMFCLFFNFNLEYPKQKKIPVYYFEFAQKVLMEMNGNKLSPKLTTFLNAVMACEVPEGVTTSDDSAAVDDTM